MADLDSALRQRAHELAMLKAREDAAKQETIIAHLSQEAARLEKLAAHPEWKWFIESYMAPLVDAERQAALDVSRSASDRDNSTHRYDLGKTLLGLLPARAAAARASAQTAAESRTTNARQ